MSVQSSPPDSTVHSAIISISKQIVPSGVACPRIVQARKAGREAIHRRLLW
jgi:hypothetical protein